MSVAKKDVIGCGIRPGEDIAPAIEPLRGRADALYVRLDPFIITNAARINSLALVARLPVMHGIRQNAPAEGLISYGPDFPDMSRRAAEIVDKILRGTKPVSLNVEQQVNENLRLFLRAGWANGDIEPPDFTDIDRTLSGAFRSMAIHGDARTIRLASPASLMAP